MTTSPRINQRAAARLMQTALALLLVACSGEPLADTCAGGLVPPAWVEHAGPRVRSIVVPAAAIAHAPELGLREADARRIDVTDLHSEDPFAPPLHLTRFGDFAHIASGAGTLATIGGQPRIARSVGAPGLYSLGYATGVAPWTDDTVVTFDANAARLSWHHPEWTFARMQLVPSLLDDLHWATPAGVLPGRRLVLHGQWTPRLATREPVVRPATPIAILDHGASEPRIILRPPGHELRAPRTQGANAIPVRGGRRTVVAVWDTLIVVGDGDVGYRLDLFNGDGEWVAQLCVPYTSSRAGRERAASPAMRPPYERVYVTTSGVLWILDAIGLESREWTALGLRQSGEVVGRLRGPLPVAPAAITDSHVYQPRPDSLGFVWLHEYEVHR